MDVKESSESFEDLILQLNCFEFEEFDLFIIP